VAGLQVHPHGDVLLLTQCAHGSVPCSPPPLPSALLPLVYRRAEVQYNQAGWGDGAVQTGIGFNSCVMLLDYPPYGPVCPWLAVGGLVFTGGAAAAFSRPALHMLSDNPCAAPWRRRVYFMCSLACGGLTPPTPPRLLPCSSRQPS
jgi:hypothetical protein